MVQKLMDEDEPNVDQIAAKMSLESQVKAAVGSHIQELPDGSIRVPVVVSQEQVEILKSWAEGAGETFEDYLQTILNMSLEATINGGAVAG